MCENNDSEEEFEDSIFAEEKSDVAMISRSDVEKCIGGQISEIYQNREAIGLLQ